MLTSSTDVKSGSYTSWSRNDSIEMYNDSSYKDDQFLMRGYNMFRIDRKKGGGGLMAFISTNIASRKVTAPAYKHVEVLAIEVKTTCSTILLVGVYRPPKAAGNDYFSKL